MLTIWRQVKFVREKKWNVRSENRKNNLFLVVTHIKNRCVCCNAMSEVVVRL